MNEELRKTAGLQDCEKARLYKMKNEKFNKVNGEWRVVNGSYRAPSAHLYGPLTTHYSPLTKKAFTLAEVLITLGIIGVVAALTMPTLIANHRKKVTVTRLQKFYSTMNQAITMSEAQNGEIKYWETENISFNPDNTLNWYKKYLQPYLNNIGIEKTSDGALVKQPDGSAFGIYVTADNTNTPHILFCVEYKACKTYIEANNNNIYDGGDFDGKNTFLFIVVNNKLYAYGISNNLTREQLMNGGDESWQKRYGCSKSFKAYCAGLIQQDGWQIKEDYPVKF